MLRSHGVSCALTSSQLSQSLSLAESALTESALTESALTDQMLRTKLYAATADSARSQPSTQIFAGQCYCYRANAPSSTELFQLGSSGFCIPRDEAELSRVSSRDSIDGRGFASRPLSASTTRRAPCACGWGWETVSRPRAINRSQGHLKETCSRVI